MYSTKTLSLIFLLFAVAPYVFLHCCFLFTASNTKSAKIRSDIMILYFLIKEIRFESYDQCTMQEHKITTALD